jgi:hypothetical protein
VDVDRVGRRGNDNGNSNSNAKTKYRDLSATQRTMRLSAASVEMTFVGGWM